jgi:tRNA(Ile)-lysidine synthetase-like protein
MDDPGLTSSLQTVPPGPWAVAVSGGADSVALLALLRSRSDLQLHVFHLDHQARGQQSADDAAFVAQLATGWNLPCTLATRAEVEPGLKTSGRNLSAHFRALRLAFFEKVVCEHRLSGVILAHHADDQAETVLQRLLRGSGYQGLCGMSSSVRFGELGMIRPLLDVSRAQLRTFLHSIKQTWREDPSNASDKYLRNRLRQYLAGHPQLTGDLLKLSVACRRLRRWTRQTAPTLDASFPVRQLADLPGILAQPSARQWLLDRERDPRNITPHAIDQLITMAADAASAARASFPGGLAVRRRKGVIFAERV